MPTDTSQRFVPDARITAAPKLPTDRPPTRAEVWHHYHSIYFDLKGHEPNILCKEGCQRLPHKELETQCAEMWAWSYVIALRSGWDKQPDWKEGDEVQAASVPPSPYETFNVANCYRWPSILHDYMKGNTA